MVQPLVAWPTTDFKPLVSYKGMVAFHKVAYYQDYLWIYQTLDTAFRAITTVLTLASVLTTLLGYTNVSLVAVAVATLTSGMGQVLRLTEKVMQASQILTAYRKHLRAFEVLTLRDASVEEFEAEYLAMQMTEKNEPTA